MAQAARASPASADRLPTRLELHRTVTARHARFGQSSPRDICQSPSQSGRSRAEAKKKPSFSGFLVTACQELGSHEAYLAGKLEDAPLSEDSLADSLAAIPQVC